MFDIWLFGSYFSSIQLNLFIDWFVVDKPANFHFSTSAKRSTWSRTAEQTNPQNRLKIDYLTNMYLPRESWMIMFTCQQLPKVDIYITG